MFESVCDCVIHKLAKIKKLFTNKPNLLSSKSGQNKTKSKTTLRIKSASAPKNKTTILLLSLSLRWLLQFENSHLADAPRESLLQNLQLYLPLRSIWVCGRFHLYLQHRSLGGFRVLHRGDFKLRRGIIIVFSLLGGLNTRWVSLGL